jgi:hypothetical protein
MIQADGTLIYRDKRQVVARVEDVSVLMQTNYFYAEEYRQAPPDVLVTVDTDLGWQVPREVQALSGSPPPTITGAAIVRVLKQTDGSLVVGSANYGLNGRVKALSTRSLHQGRVDDSTVTFLVNRQMFGNGTSLVDEPAHRGAFGFPEHFDVFDYLREPRLPASLTATPSVTDLVVVEYNFNEWIQRDQYASGKLTSTQMLQVKALAEDTMLAPIDRRSWKN